MRSNTDDGRQDLGHSQCSSSPQTCWMGRRSRFCTGQLSYFIAKWGKNISSWIMVCSWGARAKPRKGLLKIVPWALRRRRTVMSETSLYPVALRFPTTRTKWPNHQNQSPDHKYTKCPHTFVHIVDLYQITRSYLMQWIMVQKLIILNFLVIPQAPSARCVHLSLTQT